MTSEEKEVALTGLNELVRTANDFHMQYICYQRILDRNKIRLPRSMEFMMHQLRHTIQACRDEILLMQGQAPNSMPERLAR